MILHILVVVNLMIALVWCLWSTRVDGIVLKVVEWVDEFFIFEG